MKIINANNKITK